MQAFGSEKSLPRHSELSPGAGAAEAPLIVVCDGYKVAKRPEQLLG